MPKSKRNQNDGYCPAHKGQMISSGNMSHAQMWWKALLPCKLPLHVLNLIFFHVTNTVPNLWELTDANKRPVLVVICNGPHECSHCEIACLGRVPSLSKGLSQVLPHGKMHCHAANVVEHLQWYMNAFVTLLDAEDYWKSFCTLHSEWSPYTP